MVLYVAMKVLNMYLTPSCVETPLKTVGPLSTKIYKHSLFSMY